MSTICAAEYHILPQSRDPEPNPTIYTHSSIRNVVKAPNCIYSAMNGQRVQRCWKSAAWILTCLLASFLLIAVTSFFPTEDIQLQRRSVSMRLVNGRNPCEGRVEVLHNGTWGTVCDDDWDMVDSNVVCRQLDCGIAVAVGSSSRFGQGSGPILLDNVDCKGGEMDLSQCGNQGWGIHNCYHYEDVAVTCKGNNVVEPRGLEPTTPSQLITALSASSTVVPVINTETIGREFFIPESTAGTIRLIGGINRCEGRVEIYLRGEWGTVCDDAWDIADAKVVCRQMGCNLPKAAQVMAHFGPGRGPIQMDNLKCTGTEATLTQCSHIAWNVHNCDHSEDAGVTCGL
ncbi:scavenger receptor cysteine-rich domain-containing group B -like protein [Labeo rohita]|uniref:Scavenger receptor cysteine-rich domain-containing group B-like protein n=1 Tax=Labeo rohita TaxID=84645 RepID=A0A498NKW8_LABRO|nr:scavenger receptor cysteine-rich domain-containing group B -like protein [Labeo rohita]